MIAGRRSPRRARIEIIPMIDVVFFFLIFFMMATLAMAVHRGLPVHLPSAATGQRGPEQSVSLTVTKEGQTYLNKQPVTLAELPASLRALVAENPDLAVIINADEEVIHGRVVEVLDEIRGAGVSRLSIAVTPRERSRDRE